MGDKKEGVVVVWTNNWGVVQCGGVESLDRYFLHTRFIRSGTAKPKVGQTVVFEVSPAPPKKDHLYPAAIRADVIVEPVAPKSEVRS